MNKALVVQEIGIGVVVKNHNPALLTYDFLKYSGIVPAEWELTRQPIASNQGSQIIFRNGVNLVAQPERLSFVELMNTKALSEVQTPAIARKYIEALPNLEYQAIGTNFKGYITSAQLAEEVTPQDYILKSLFTSAPWQSIGSEPVKTSVQLAFTLEHGPFNLVIEEGRFYVTEQETIPIVLFSGNFSYRVEANSSEERLEFLYQCLENWQRDLETYQDIINTKFLQSETVSVSY